MKFIFYFLLSFNYLFANLILDNDDFGKLSLEKYTKQYIDKDSKFSLEDIKNINFEESSKFNYKPTKSHIWTYFEVTSLETQEVIFQNLKASIDYIDVYILKDNKFYKKIELGDLRDIKQRDIQSKKSSLSILLEKDEKYQFYINHNSYSSISTLWYIFSKKNFLSYQNKESLIWGFFIGVVFIFILNNIYYFLYSKDKTFLTFIIIIVLTASYQLLKNGLYYEYLPNINLQLLDGLNSINGFLFLQFIILFQICILKHKKDSLQFKTLALIFILNFLIVIFSIITISNAEIRFESGIYYEIFTCIIFFVLFWDAYISYKQKLPIALYYLIFFCTYSLFYFYIMLVLFGYLNYFEYFWILIPFFTLINMLYLSFIIFSKSKVLKKEKMEQEKLLLSQSRFTTLGNNVANVIHQWKNPIAQFASQIALLETTYKLDKKNFFDTYEEVIPDMKNSILFLKNTMNDIYNFYKNPLEKEKFNPDKEIESLLRIINQQIVSNRIVINKNIDKNIEIFNFKTYFLNVIMIIFENAIYQLKNNKEENKVIYINLYKSQKLIILEIEDTGGGIENKNLDKIFDLDFTTKKENGSGIGLALAKKLVKKRLNGEIKAENGDFGAKFIIHLFNK